MVAYFDSANRFISSDTFCKRFDLLFMYLRLYFEWVLIFVNRSVIECLILFVYDLLDE